MTQTMGLAMIVRDNAHCLARCLESVKGLVSTAVVVDTGSTDGTQEIARAFGAKVHERPWVDFGHNRTELMQLSRGAADYLLLLDADETLEQHDTFPRLSAPAYMLRLRAGDLLWRAPRLVRGDAEWAFVGARHEYLAGPLAADRADLDAISITHHGDGWAWEKKLAERQDVEALEAAVAADPGDARSWFYLARTYKDHGRIDDAIRAYEQRATLNGWEDERFLALYEAGCLWCVHRDAREGIRLLAQAFRLQPHRAEPLRALAHISTHIADRLPLPDGLFVDSAAYKA